jgi:hypothetical protein
MSYEPVSLYIGVHTSYSVCGMLLIFLSCTSQRKPQIEEKVYLESHICNAVSLQLHEGTVNFQHVIASARKENMLLRKHILPTSYFVINMNECISISDFD